MHTDSSPTATAEPEVVVKYIALMVLGVVLVAIGFVWLLQGLGYIHGSGMTGNTLWAVVGPVVAVIGAVLALQGQRGRRRRA